MLIKLIMLSKLSRPLRMQRFFNFSKKKNNDFVFTSKKKKRENQKTVVDQSTQTGKDSQVPSSPDSKISDEITYNMNIAKKIYENNPVTSQGESFTVIDWLKNGGKVEDFASDKMKKYPFHVDHWNPQSKGYVPSER